MPKRLYAILTLLLFTAAASQAQTCTSSLFLKDLGVNAPVASFLLPLPGGGTLLGGAAYGQPNHVSIVKTTPDGEVLWNKEVDFGLYSNLTRAALSPAKKLVVAQGPALALLDTNGTVLRGARANLSAGTLLLYDMKLDGGGNVVVLYRDAWSTPYAWVLVKFLPDLSGIVWAQRFYKFEEYFGGLMADENKVLVCGLYRTGTTDTLDGTLLCFNNGTGAFEKQVSYTLDGFRTGLNNVYKTADGYLAEAFHNPGSVPYSASTHSLLHLDTALLPTKALRLTSFLNIHQLALLPDDDGGFFGGVAGTWGTFFRLNARDSITWTRTLFPSHNFIERFARSSANLYALEGNCWALYKMDLNGKVGACTSSDYAVQTVPMTPAVKNKAPVTLLSAGVTYGSGTFAALDRPFQTAPVCSATSTCTSVRVAGSSAVCTNGGAVLFKGRRNAGCRLPVQWQLNGAPVEKDRLNDSTLSVTFLQSGTYQVVASLPADCAVIADTLVLQVSVMPQLLLNLGPDRELCPGNTLLLNAGKGYASYAWQDGSADSTFTVVQPGLYYVTATDACGGTFKDSVTVTAAPSIPFNAGPDRTKCNGDTLHLSAPPGFLNYTWSNNYNISSLTLQNVVVNPLVDTAYYLKAEKTPGCFAFDTVQVRVYGSPPINLGNDKSFCTGDSVVFDAGTGFQTYAWSNGQTTQTIIVKAAGQYSVTAATLQNCSSLDTVAVAVYPLPVVRLDKNPALCTGTSRTLDAGNFSSYQWNTGAATPSVTVNSLGLYAVTVTDANGCKGSDTANITKLAPLPAGFLPMDTAICSYGLLELKPAASFRKYFWNTGGTTPSIAVTQPGLYWLDVVDADACKGRDTVVVNPKDCINGFYAPSAFTPNADGRNDKFGPLLLGLVKKYRFAVYNRWGQTVFQTTDPQKGWDGTVAGTPQKSGVFVWTCSYQFENEPEKREKGTVTLLR